MKYIILFFYLLSINAYAEWKIDITNNEGQKLSQDGFETEAEANIFISSTKHRWGLDRRWTFTPCDSPIETREVEIEGSDKTEYQCPATYTTVISNISAQRVDEYIDAAIDKNVNCGMSVIKYVSKRNLAKGITSEEVETVINAYSTINAMLMSGSLSTAIVKISTEPVTALITQEDKDSIIAKINSCKAN